MIQGGESSLPRYSVLTGSKNNAGDFLIKFRAKELLSSLRPDREIVDLNAWEPFSADDLATVNQSKALILLGGPSVQKGMVPKIYPMAENLADIKVPITTMGIGWKSLSGNWADTRSYSLNDRTIELFSRLKEDGLSLSVRDYHTMNVMAQYGLDSSVLMTGCPATYDTKHIGREFRVPESVHRVAFSLGVSFLYSARMQRQMKACILSTKETFPDAKFDVIFHHGTTKTYLTTPGSSGQHLAGHLRFIDWLQKEDISYIDISGSAENLVDCYSACDLHVGYRVHAHIFMNSISKPSILIAEDGRGKALRQVFGGLVYDAFDEVGSSMWSKAVRAAKLYETFTVFKNLHQEVVRGIRYEVRNGFPSAKSSRAAIDVNYTMMKKYIEELP